MSIKKGEFVKAKRVLRSKDNQTISYLQRHLQIGWNKARVIFYIIQREKRNKLKFNKKFTCKK